MVVGSVVVSVGSVVVSVGVDVVGVAVVGVAVVGVDVVVGWPAVMVAELTKLSPGYGPSSEPPANS
jgi:hypothetical protein